MDWASGLDQDRRFVCQGEDFLRVARQFGSGLLLARVSTGPLVVLAAFLPWMWKQGHKLSQDSDPSFCGNSPYWSAKLRFGRVFWAKVVTTPARQRVGSDSEVRIKIPEGKKSQEHEKKTIKKRNGLKATCKRMILVIGAYFAHDGRNDLVKICARPGIYLPKDAGQGTRNVVAI